MEILVPFSARSLGETCFCCIAHAGTDIPRRAGAHAVLHTHAHAARAHWSWDICSCVLYKRTKAVSPKILRGGRPSLTCTILSTNMLYTVQISYEVHLSVYDMFCMCYSRISFGRNAREKSRPRKTPDLMNQTCSRPRCRCSEITNRYSFIMHCVWVCIVS